MKIGYARVSTVDQNLDFQRDALTSAGCEVVIEDEASGATAFRPGLEKVRACTSPSTPVAPQESSRFICSAHWPNLSAI